MGDLLPMQWLTLLFVVEPISVSIGVKLGVLIGASLWALNLKLFYYRENFLDTYGVFNGSFFERIPSRSIGRVAYIKQSLRR